MIAVIRTDNHTFNLFGTRDDKFCLEGNLTKAELTELLKQIKLVLKVK